MGIESLSLDVSENPVFMRVFRHFLFCHFAFATLLQHVDFKRHFATDEIVSSGFREYCFSHN